MFNGFASWLAYIIALLQEMGSHLFIPGSVGFAWEKVNGEWILVSANLPQLSEGGKDVVGSLLTILHIHLSCSGQHTASSKYLDELRMRCTLFTRTPSIGDINVQVKGTNLSRPSDLVTSYRLRN